MMMVANELGFEGEEFEDLGLELEESRCKMGVCNLKFADVKGMDKLMNV
jgi:hypothetical protein